jgi:hypothetical protein
VARIVTPAVRLLDDGYTRIGEHVSAVVDGLDADDLSHRIAPEANTIGWLVWHLLRVQDDHVADVAGSEQVWTSKDWFGPGRGRGRLDDLPAAGRVRRGRRRRHPLLAA